MRTKALISVGLLFALCAPTLARDDGVQVGNPSFLRRLVSAQRVEEAAFLQFEHLKGQAQAKQALLPPITHRMCGYGASRVICCRTLRSGIRAPRNGAGR